MHCYKPLKAHRLPNGGPVVFDRAFGHGLQAIKLPCGQCVGCRLERSRQWAVRCLHEAKMHGDANSFVTLTYDDDHLPIDSSLRYRDFQLFMKKLRKSANAPIRFFMCGEYGDKLGRPHYHALLFGHYFHDRYYWKMSEVGCKVYRSDSLTKLWTYGDSYVGDVNFESAAYVARYVMKKYTYLEGVRSPQYTILDVSTGELSFRCVEFCHMSLKPGIGARFYRKYRDDLFPHGKAVSRGVEQNTPRYYDKLFKKDDLVAFEKLRLRREEIAKEKEADNTDDRLRVKELVAKARIGLLKRNFG